MIRRLATLILIFSAIVASAKIAGAGDLSLVEIYRRNYRSVGTIVTGNLTGSCFFVSNDGCVLTALHCVNNGSSSKVFVTEEDGSQKVYGAKILGKVPALDVAMLKVEKIKKSEHQTVCLGNSKKLRAGQAVCVIGTPFFLDFHGSISLSIIGFVNRIAGTNAESIKYRIQIDKPFHPGSSGSPVFDMNGRVVGMIEADVQGKLSLAIPISLLNLPFLKKGDMIVPEIGLDVSDQSPTITNVIANNLKSFIQSGDAISSIDKVRIRNASDLNLYLLGKKPGGRVKVSIIKLSGKKTTKEVTLWSR